MLGAESGEAVCVCAESGWLVKRGFREDDVLATLQNRYACIDQKRTVRTAPTYTLQYYNVQCLWSYEKKRVESAQRSFCV